MYWLSSAFSKTALFILTSTSFTPLKTSSNNSTVINSPLSSTKVMKLLSLAENDDPKAVELMMDWAHGPAGHFGGHPVPGLYHINTGSMLAKTRTIKNTLGVDFRACDNYKNGFEAAKKIKIPTLSILATDDKMCPVKEGKKLADLIEGSQVDIIDNCGHMMLLEEADRVLKVLKKFITTNYPPKK